MQKYLKAIIAFLIYVLAWQHYFRSNLADLKIKKQNYANMYKSSMTLEQKIGDKTKKEILLDILAQQRNLILKERKEIENLIPDISITRKSLVAPFDIIRKKLNDQIDFKVSPEKEYSEKDEIIYWKYNLEITNSMANVIRLMSAIESSDIFIGILEFDIVGKDKAVNMKMQVEVAYKNNSTNGAKK